MAQHVAGDVIDEDQKKGCATEKIEPNVARRPDGSGRCLRATARGKEPGRMRLANGSGDRLINPRISHPVGVHSIGKMPRLKTPSVGRMLPAIVSQPMSRGWHLVEAGRILPEPSCVTRG
jgi:hypothetical protein